MENLTGKIEFMLFAEGTKSESLQPFLIDKNGKKIRIYKKNDNPFMNNYFTAFEGKSVCISGEYSNEIFIVDSITDEVEAVDSEIVSSSDPENSSDEQENIEQGE
jgi:hypothetical protein